MVHRLLIAVAFVVDHGLWETRPLVAAAHGLSCPSACGFFPDQASNLCLLHWQGDCLPLNHKGSPGGLFNTAAEVSSLFDRPRLWSLGILAPSLTSLLTSSESPCIYTRTQKDKTINRASAWCVKEVCSFIHSFIQPVCINTTMCQAPAATWGCSREGDRASWSFLATDKDPSACSEGK